MKKNCMPVAALLSILALLGTGCFNALQPDDPPAGPALKDGQGLIRVSLGTGARTLLPDTEGLYYVLTFTSATESPVTAFSGTTSAQQALAAGSWDLEVRGYISQAAYQADDDDYGLLGTAEDIAIVAGQATPVTVTLAATDTGNGALAFDLSFPDDVTSAALEFVKLLKTDGENDPAGVDLMDAEYLTTGDPASQSQGAVALPAGYYRITARLAITETGKTRRLVKTLTAHIKGSLQTALAETFAEGDFRNYFTTVAGLTTWLSAQPANDAATPYSVALEMPMSGLLSGSNVLGSLLGSSYSSNAGRYIDLDLSACTGASTGSAISGTSGAKLYLVSVIFPPNSLPATMPTFTGFSNLKSIAIPEGVKDMFSGAVANCPEITSITLPSTLDSIVSTAIMQCTKIKSVTLPTSLKSFDGLGRCFSGNLDLVFTLTGNVSGAGYQVQDDGKTLVYVNAENKTTIIAAPGLSGTLTIDDTVTAIAGYAFAKNTAITGVDASGATALASIGASAFDGTTSLATLDLSGTPLTALTTVTTQPNAIGPAVKTLKLPAGLTSISGLPATLEQLEFTDSLSVFSDGAAFQSCTNLAGFTVTVGSGTANYSVSDDNKTLFNADKSKLIASVATANNIPASVTAIANYAFYQRAAGAVVIPSNVATIGNYAFNGADATSLDLSGATGLQTIGNYAFNGCAGITSLDLSGATGLQSIGNYAFVGTGITGALNLSTATALTSIGTNAFQNTGITGALAIPAQITSIGSSAFAGCAGITSVDLSAAAGLTSIPAAFSGCTGITAFPSSIHANITSIAANAFQNTGITGALVIPAQITSIGSSAFAGCAGITSVDLSAAAGLTSIPGAFSGCTGITAFPSIPTTITSIEASALQNTGITGALVIPATITSIGTDAFNGCTKITSLTINGNSLASIGNMAFKGCTSLAWVKWHESAADATITGASSTANGAFNGCTALTKVELPDGLTNIGNRTFQGCTAVLFYILNGTTPPTIAANTFAGSGSYPIYVPDGAVSTYKGTSVWSTATYTSKITSVNSLPSQDEPSNW